MNQLNYLRQIRKDVATILSDKYVRIKITVLGIKIMTENESGYVIKLIMLGESGVGKTSIINSFINENFEQNISTANSAFFSKDIYVEKIKITFELWDTAGQEKFRNITDNYYKFAKIALLVYDITSMTSFKEIKDYWIDELKQKTNNEISI